jgi:serine/threonine-protein kinase
MGVAGSRSLLGCVHQPNGQLRPVAFVLLPDQAEEDPDLLRRVVAETGIAIQIGHANVLGVLGIVQLPVGYARVVDYAEAESLRALYRAATAANIKVPPPVVISLVADACMGVHFAHDIGMSLTGDALVHGGIRPETLMVGYHGVTRVSGYGAFSLAAALERAQGAEVSIRDAYTAPEQTFGGRRAATVQTDVYALGAVLHEALLGKAPLRADSDEAEARVQEALSRPMPGLTGKLAAIVLHAMRRRSADRYESALAMRQALLDTGAAAPASAVGAFMGQLFPPSTPARVNRKQMLDMARLNPPPAQDVPLLTAAVGLVAGLTQGTPAPAPVAAPPPAVAPVAAPPEPATSQPVVELDPLLDAPHELDAEPLPVEAVEPQEDAVFADPPDPPPPQPAPAKKAATRPGQKPQRAATTRPGAPAPRPVANSRPRPRLSAEDLEALAEPRAPAQGGNAKLYLALGITSGVAVTLGALLFLNPAARDRLTGAPGPAPARGAGDAKQPAPAEAPDAGASASKGGFKVAVAAPEPVPPPDTILSITGNPASGDLYLDGQLVGKGSHSGKVTPGQHTVRLKDPGGAYDVSRRVELTEGEKKKFSIRAGRGVLIIDAPPGCDVTVDGKRVGTTPLDGIELFEGRRSVVVKKGAVPYKQVVDMKADMEATLHVEFRKE